MAREAGLDFRAPLRVLFSVRPFRGHLHPLIPLARAFERAGHQVAVASAGDVATVVTSAGLTWFPAGFNPREAWEAFGDDPDYGAIAIRAKVDDLLDIAVEQFSPDVVIREPTDLAAAIAAELIGGLSVTFGVAHFIPLESWQFLGADQAINEVRRDYGLPEDAALGCLHRDLYLTLLPPSFEIHHPLPVPAVQRLRYVPWDGDAGDRPAVGGESGTDGQPARPRVLVTLGTVYNTHSGLFSRCLEALADEPIDVICTLGEGADPSVVGQPRANVRFERYRPHSSILPSCGAMLCHGGFNTVMGSLIAGVPVVCVPLGSDNEYNARRSAANGVGLWLRDEEASPERIRDNIHRVLTEPSFARRARAFRAEMARSPGLAAAVGRIETLAADRRSREAVASNHEL